MICLLIFRALLNSCRGASFDLGLIPKRVDGDNWRNSLSRLSLNAHWLRSVGISSKLLFYISPRSLYPTDPVFGFLSSAFFLGEFL